MAHAAELLSPFDLAMVVLAAVLVVFALVGAGALAFGAAPALRRAGAEGRADALMLLAGVQAVMLVAAPIVLGFAGSSALDAYGASSMLPIVLAPAAKAAVPLLIAVLAADAAAWLGAAR